MENYAVIDLFCGAGGLTHGFVSEKFDVVAGFDADEACRYPYERNNAGAKFVHRKIEDVTAAEIEALYPPGCIKILVGCAPCQPYSKYTQKRGGTDDKWKLISIFGELISQVDPDVVSMENVPNLAMFQGGELYRRFIDRLKKTHHVDERPKVYCPDYGIPQHRTRLVVLASKFGPIKLLPETHSPAEYGTVERAIGRTEPLEAGQVSPTDRLHRASRLSDMNLRRIRASLPGGTWRDWPTELIAECHLKRSGETYPSVYGRMTWGDPAPTITGQCHGYGNGRFGHPEQDRAISLREAALLQTFPEGYEFVAPGDPVQFSVVGRLIGNAVPVDLGRVIARSIKCHLEAVIDRRGRR